MKTKEVTMKTKAGFFSVMVSLFLMFGLAPGAMAAYPENPIEIVVHASAGGGSDLFARQVAHFLEKEGIVKQKMQVTNRTGGGAAVALNYLDSKKGDPYVFMQGVTSPLTTMMRGATRLKIEDLVLIAKMVEDPNLMFVRFDSPFKNLTDVIAVAKKAPKTVSVAISTIGGTEHICANRIAQAAGIQFNIVAFKGGGECATALLGGHVDLTVANPQEQMGMIEAKKIRPLVTMTPERIPFMADVPTVKEAGLNVSYTQFRGFWAAPGFPASAVVYWEDAFRKLMKVQGFRDYLKSIQTVEAFLGHDEFKKYIVTYVQGLHKDMETLEMYKAPK
jgi:putative tricarboxylic transport membrane protein